MLETQGILLNKHSNDGKLLTQSIARPLGTYSCFISEGDDISNQHHVGNGTKMQCDHKINDPLQQMYYVDLNVKENKTFIQQGHALMKNANLDKIIFEIITSATVCSAGTNTFFNLYGGFLIVPAAGNGTINVAQQDMKLVEMSYSIDDPSSRIMPAFWNATYDPTTQTFTNITAAPNGDGQYNLFTYELVLEKVSNIIVVGDTRLDLDTNNVAEFGHGMRIRLTFVTNPPDHDWQVAITLGIHRQHTSDF
jgi:hypothetical protein